MDSEDILDAVDAVEQEKYAAGRAEGEEDGVHNHHQTGFVLGWQQASHILQELGRVEGKLQIKINKLINKINSQINDIQYRKFRET